MKNYRCVFNYAGGNTTIEVAADDSDQAIEVAAAAISAGDYDRVEVWDGEDLLLTKTTRRAWDALGDPSSTEPPQAQTAASHPRRTPTSLTASLKGIGSGMMRWPRKASRKG